MAWLKGAGLALEASVWLVEADPRVGAVTVTAGAAEAMELMPEIQSKRRASRLRCPVG
jgi:hypothetical protein